MRFIGVDLKMGFITSLKGPNHKDFLERLLKARDSNYNGLAKQNETFGIGVSL